MNSFYFRWGKVIIFALTLVLMRFSVATAEAIAPESSEAATARHQQVTERRKGIQIICHRGSLEFAHENTLEAYRATFDLGGDGNEIDIHATKDGVLICFHDDMLDHLLEAYGDASDYTWDELQRFAFRNPGQFGKDCRIPTLEEALELHRQHAGLVQLDIKRPEVIPQVVDLVSRMDMWDHIVAAPAGVKHPNFKSSAYKASLFSDRGEVDPAVIAEAIKKPGDYINVEDPRGIAIFLGRKIRRPPQTPVAPLKLDSMEPERPQSIPELLDILKVIYEQNPTASDAESQRLLATRITNRAKAADQLGHLDDLSEEIVEVLRQRVVNRSLHHQWQYQGLDGAAALRALLKHQAPKSADLARFCLWRDDPNCEAFQDPQWTKYPRSWIDWRTKIIIFPYLAKHTNEEAVKLCHDYLALSDEAARQIGMLQFDVAAKTLLTIRPEEQTAIELMKHRRSDVRGRAVLCCVSCGHESWAHQALSKAAPHALAYVLPQK